VVSDNLHPAVDLTWLVSAVSVAHRLSVVLLQVPYGAWFTLMMAGIYAVIMSIWFWGANQKAR
jgi:K+ transporter